MMLLVSDFLEQSALHAPDKIALVSHELRLTYGKIDLMANRLANALCDVGVSRGDRTVLLLPNSVELVVGIFAVLKASGTFVVVNTSTKQDKLLYLLNDCRATALISHTRYTSAFTEMQDRVPSLKLIVLAGECNLGPDQHAIKTLAFDSIQRRYPATRPPRQSIDQDLACLIYTSGSTGEPKGVMSAHNNVVFAASSITTYLANTPDDIVLSVIPLSFDYGLYQLLMVFKFGGTLVLENSFAYPAAILKRLESERITGFPGVPTIFSLLLQMDLDRYDFGNLRYITNTAAALPASHISQIREKFPWVQLYSMYGLTETKRTLYLPPDQVDSHPGSVGIPIPGTEVWLEDDQGGRLGPNQIGELVIRGSHVMRGYWEDNEATLARFRQGPIPGERVCYSGDLFRRDEAGYYYFVGRKDDIIKSRGEKVAPKEIENVLYNLPGVTEASVVGLPDSILGEAIKVFVVAKGNRLSERDVLRHCRAYLEDYMVPQKVEFLESLPKTANGKIDKLELMARSRTATE